MKTIKFLLAMLFFVSVSLLAQLNDEIIEESPSYSRQQLIDMYSKGVAPDLQYPQRDFHKGLDGYCLETYIREEAVNSFFMLVSGHSDRVRLVLPWMFDQNYTALQIIDSPHSVYTISSRTDDYVHFEHDYFLPGRRLLIFDDNNMTMDGRLKTFGDNFVFLFGEENDPNMVCIF